MELPRAELCCDIGDCFLEKGVYEMAIYWYETALQRPYPQKSGGFISKDRYGVYPALQLTLCYDRLGNQEKAVFWNERAGDFDPEHPAFIFNRELYKRKTRP